MATDVDLPIDLPLPDFLRWAAERNEAHYDAQISNGEFVTPLFEFVRCARAHPDLAKLNAQEAFNRVRKIIPWGDWFPESDEPELEFLSTWDKVRVPAGQGDTLIYAAGLARDRPIKIRGPIISANYSHFVSIAFHLQILRAGKYINLPVARLGEILEVNPRTVSHYVEQAKRDGLLSLLEKHHALSRQAAKYTFNCDRFNMKTGEVNPF
jgi:hypothetical protein